MSLYGICCVSWIIKLQIHSWCDSPHDAKKVTKRYLMWLYTIIHVFIIVDCWSVGRLLTQAVYTYLLYISESFDCVLVRRRARKRHFQNAEDSDVKKRLTWKVHVCSENNFPTAAGLASSAAGLACLGLCCVFISCVTLYINIITHML